MHINLPDKTSDVLAKLDNEQKGLIFSALMSHVQGKDIENHEQAMAPEAFMAYQFLAMWNDAQKEKFQRKSIKHNPEARTASE